MDLYEDASSYSGIDVSETYVAVLTEYYSDVFPESKDLIWALYGLARLVRPLTPNN